MYSIGVLHTHSNMKPIQNGLSAKPGQFIGDIKIAGLVPTSAMALAMSRKSHHCLDDRESKRCGWFVAGNGNVHTLVVFGVWNPMPQPRARYGDRQFVVDIYIAVMRKDDPVSIQMFRLKITILDPGRKADDGVSKGIGEPHQDLSIQYP